MSGLNFSDSDLAVQLHFAIFNGSEGFVLKPTAMSASPDQNEMTRGNISDSHGDYSPTAAEPGLAGQQRVNQWQQNGDIYWPLACQRLHRTTLRVLSLHHLPKVRALLFVRISICVL